MLSFQLHSRFFSHSIKIFLSVIFVLVSNTSFAGLNDGIVGEFTKDLNSDYRQRRIDAYKIIHRYGGFSDSILFGRIENFLQTCLNNNSPIQQQCSDKDEVSWALKALASSGNPNYDALLKQLAYSNAVPSRVNHHAETAIENKEFYREWNAAMKSVPFAASKHDPRRIVAYKSLVRSKNQRVLEVVYRNLFDYSGIQDPEIFDQIAKNLVDIQAQNKGLTTHEVEHVAWMMKALSSSGNNKYIEVIKAAAKLPVDESGDSNKNAEKLKRHSENSIEYIEKFARWNKVLSNRSNEKPEREDRIADVLDLWQSNQTEMQLYAVRQAHGFELFDSEFMQGVQKYLLANYSPVPKDKTKLDLLAWIGKYMSKYQSEENLRALNQVYDALPRSGAGQQVAKLRKHIRTGIKQYPNQ